MKPYFLSTVLAAALLPGVMTAAVAQEQVPPAKQQAQDQEYIYGSQLMTEQERAEHRAKMRAAKTDQEREKVRLDHHKKMQARAKERGVTLPDEPLPRGGGKSQGPGAGSTDAPGGGGY
jgi:hypothetical protein